jgi:hypothetical protein
MTSYHQQWIALDSRTRSDLRTILNQDPFEWWEQNRMPESVAEMRFIYALRIACADPASPDCRAFLQQALAVADRAMREGKLVTGRCASAFPENRGRLLRVRAYTEVLLGRPLDEAALRQASADYIGWCAKFGPSDWDSQLQAYYLTAVRAALLGGDATDARQLLATKKRFNWHAEEHDLLTRLAGDAVELPLPHARRAELLPVMDGYFDKIRDPNYKPQVFLQVHSLRLDLALLRDKYLISPDGRVDGRRAVEAIAA